MRIATWNVNGIRACAKKGLIDWLTSSALDFVCLQEVKACEADLDWTLSGFLSYQVFVNPASRKGYAGTAVYYLRKPLRVETRLGYGPFDEEGRLIRFDSGGLSLVNLYLPHGGRDKSGLAYKIEAYRHLLSYLEPLKEESVILAGDFNVAHTELDLARPRQNEDNIMFTSEERQQFDRIIRLGFVDAFRDRHLEGGHYTWWPYGFSARRRNVGWRLDYFFVSKRLRSRVRECEIAAEVTGSDHCPVILEIQ